MDTVTYVPVPACEWIAPLRALCTCRVWSPKCLPMAALQLPDGEDGLHQAGGADRVPAGDQTAGRVDRASGSFWQLQSVIDARHEGLAGGGKWTALSVAAQSQVFVGLDLAGGVGVVQLDEIQFLQRVLDAGHFVGHIAGRAPGAEGVHARVTCAVLP